MDSLLCERWRDFSDFSWENESGREERELSSAVSVSSFFNWLRSGRGGMEVVCACERGGSNRAIDSLLGVKTFTDCCG